MKLLSFIFPKKQNPTKENPIKKDSYTLSSVWPTKEMCKIAKKTVAEVKNEQDVT